jgi:cystathionine beta-lyase family protein involved in aluminum resistance
MDFGITFSAVDLKEGGDFDEKAILDYLKGHRVKMVYIQRSGGYDSRGAVTVDRIAAIIETIKKDHPDVMVMVDNCYGEFIETREPTHVGADLMAGSLIKNPGGGLALSGGYIAGREKWIHRVAERLTAPGIAKEVGTSYGQTRIVLQGLFLAPGVVNAALRGALLLGRMALTLGYEIVPGITDERSDIIQGIVLKEPGKVVDFCQGVQNAAPVDAHVRLEPWAMPGYQSPVIMAAGAFVQGSSIELSADAPMREPYTVYFQGGLTYEHSKLGALMGLARIYKD